MTTAVAKYAMKKVMGKEMEKYKKKDVSGPYVRTCRVLHPTTTNVIAGPLLRTDPASKEAGQDQEGQEGNSCLHSAP